MILECKLTFEAAHRNTSAQATTHTSRLHGHSYVAVIAVEGPLDSRLGWVMDFAEVKERAIEVIDRLDHRILNDIDGVRDSTTSDMTRWLTERLREILPAFHDCSVSTLGDTDWSPCISRAEQGTERFQFGFAAAHYLPALPETHKCRRIHGHSFRVAISSKDASRLADPLRDIYERLDHRLLNEIAGLENPTSELLAEWISKELMRSKRAFDEVMVAETCRSSCRLSRTS